MKRAAMRFKDKTHANRRAERAEQLYKKEALERQDDQAKATALFANYNQTISALKASLLRAQQARPSGEQSYGMQAAKAELGAAIAQQKETTAQLQASANQRLQEMQSRIEGDKAQISKDAEQYYQRSLEEAKKKIEDDTLHKSKGKISQLQAQYQSEIATLRQQLQEKEAMINWYRGQMQQQTTLRASAQGTQVNAGIHAGIPLPTQEHSIQPQALAYKRARHNSDRYVFTIDIRNHQANINSNASLPTPEKRRERENSMRSIVSPATPMRKAQTAARKQAQPSRHPVTPTRQTTTPRQHQPSNTQESPFQQFHQSQFQLSPLPPHLRGSANGERERLFANFLQQYNIQRANRGQAPCSSAEGTSAFRQWLTLRANQQSPARLNGDAAHCSMPLHNEISGQGLGQMSGMNRGLDSSVCQQTMTPFNKSSFSANQATAVTHAQQFHQASLQQRQQQPRPNNNIFSQSSAGSSEGLNNMWPVSTNGFNVTPSATSSCESTNVQATLQQGNIGGLDAHLAAQMSSQLQSTGIYPSPEDSEGRTEGSQCGGHTQAWDSPASRPGNESFGMSNDRLPFGRIDSHTFGDNFSFNSFPTLGSTPPLPTAPGQINQQYSDEWESAQNRGNFPSKTTQNHLVDPASQASSNSQSAPFQQRFVSETPTVASFSSSQAAPTNPSTSRKCPAPPLSTRSTPIPSGRSTPTPAGSLLTVCLHCHENWWNDTCDAGEPCQNCIGAHKLCERPGCHVERENGMCNVLRCPRIHKRDIRYRNMVLKPKTLKRHGKKDERQSSPVEMMRQRV